MFVHKDAVDGQAVSSLMKTGSRLTLAGLGSSLFAKMLQVGAGIVERLLEESGWEATVRLTLLAFAVCGSFTMVVGMILFYMYVES